MKDLFSPQQHLKWSGVVFAVIVAMATSAYLPATAQEEGIIALGEWSYKDLESGWTAEEIMDADVIGDDGEEIGSLENLLLTEEGKVVAIVAEIGGFWNIGVTHVAVPWNETEWEDGGLILPVTEDNVEDYSLFDEYFSRYDVGEITTVDDDLATGPDIWKVTSLLDDYALLENNVGYGYVDDLIFNDNGQLEFVVINATNPDYDYGYYAYPWYGYGYADYAWDPELDYYILPYSDEELADL